MVKIRLITTLKTNIGDDFIREGIYLLLKEVFGEHDKGSKEKKGVEIRETRNPWRKLN